MEKNLAEQAEQEALISIHRCASSLRQKLGLELLEIDGAAVSICRVDPSILLNRSIGLGREQTASEQSIESIIRLYADAGIDEFFLQITPDAKPKEIHQWLLDSKLKKNRGWMKFSRGVELPENKTTEFVIKRVGVEYAEEFASIVVPAFDMREDSIPLIASLVNDKRWHLFIGFNGNRAAGTGALFVFNGVAYYDWAATRPEFRGRGCQSAILRRLIGDAIEAKCNELVTTTGEAWPGDPQHSYHNILRAGFVETYLRENWSLSQKKQMRYSIIFTLRPTTW